MFHASRLGLLNFELQDTVDREMLPVVSILTGTKRFPGETSVLSQAHPLVAILL